MLDAAALPCTIREGIAAALRAAVKQLTFYDSFAGEVINPRKLLDIAAELGPTTSAIHELRKGPGNPYGDEEAKQ